MSPIGFGVIGAGAIGRLHARHLSSQIEGARLVAVSDIARDAAASCAEATGATAYDDHRELLANPDVKAVVIASPPDTHAELIEQSAAAGKQIFCEKPIDCELEKIDRALAAIARAGVKLQIGFNRRFDAKYHAVHEAIATGKIGRPLILHIISRDPKLPVVSDTRDVAGMLLDMTIHDFDMARHLAGEVTELYALADRMRDTALIMLRFASGAFGTIDNGQAAYGYDQRVEVFGTDGMIATENEKPHIATLTDSEGRLYFFIERYAESYRRELEAFIECVQRDTEPPVTGADGRLATVIALAAQRSCDVGRPVALSEFGEG